ncbi:hypothetical protein AGR7C_Cc110308 [Agrobacterium deltaense Zutra 3/1]|uniref:Uncharacterized protein n=1 Tax=Agrobacterium deltaense Zutra 3/1 TaxID=1183427 RepID=A0A1S7P3H7_9HYPH|nr:hypothetical protein AGR7C_Cc110308 [Agrobacterium deltaense Zutra 3/1]
MTEVANVTHYSERLKRRPTIALPNHAVRVSIPLVTMPVT